MFSSELQVGIAYALLAGALWGVGPLLLKRALKYTNVSTATLVEQHVSVFLLVGLAIYYGEIGQIDFSGRAFWSFFVAGGVGASFGKVFYYKGIDKVGASKATSVKNSSPFLTAVLAVLFLGEQMSWLLLAGVTLIVFGIVVLTQTPDSGERSVDRFQYFLFPIISALCFGVNPIFKKDRYQCRQPAGSRHDGYPGDGVAFHVSFCEANWPANQARTGAAVEGAGVVHTIGHHRGFWIALYFLCAELWAGGAAVADVAPLTASYFRAGALYPKRYRSCHFA